MAYLSRATEFALAKAGRDCDFQLNPKKKEIIDAAVCRKKDVLGILPTGFGKSLVFHLLSDVELMEAGQPPAKGRSTTIVLSPLNALMVYQISKLGHIGVVVLDDTKETNDLAILQAREGKLQLVFSHSEFVIENTTKSTLKTSTFQKHVRCIVVDEVHLVNDWWVLLFVLLPEVAAMGHSILYPHTPPPIEVLIIVMLVRPLRRKKLSPFRIQFQANIPSDL